MVPSEQVRPLPRVPLRAWRGCLSLVLAGGAGTAGWVLLRWLDGDPGNDLTEGAGLGLLLPVVFVGFLFHQVRSTVGWLHRYRSGALAAQVREDCHRRMRLGHRPGEALEQAVERAHGAIERAEGWAALGGNVLLTLGLVGTAVGLMQALGGLSRALGALGSGGTEFNAGLEAALSGMSTAFLTTLLGAVLGGIALRVLAALAAQLAGEVLELQERALAEELSAAVGKTTPASGGC